MQDDAPDACGTCVCRASHGGVQGGGTEKVQGTKGTASLVSVVVLKRLEVQNILQRSAKAAGP